MFKSPSKWLSRDKEERRVEIATPERVDHLSDILTDWKMIRDAHCDTMAASDVGPIHSARRVLWERYQQAIRRYLMRIVNDPVAAEDLFQEFTLKMLQGGLRNADPEKGKFRKYLRTSLANMARDYYNKTKKGPNSFPEEMSDPAAGGPTDPSAAADALFLEDWRDALLKASWDRLKAEEKASGRPYMTALKLYVRHSGEGSAKLAERMSQVLDKPVTAAYFNKQVHNARKQHAFFLIDEVSRTLSEDASLGEIEEELIALGLHEYQICKDALRDYHDILKRRKSPAEPVARVEAAH